MAETVSHNKPKKCAFASHNIAKEGVMNVLGPPSPLLTPLTESQQICVLNKVKNGPKMPKNGPKRAEIYEKGFFGPKIPVLCAIFLAEFWVPPSFSTEIGLPNKISGIGRYHLHLEKSGLF